MTELDNMKRDKEIVLEKWKKRLEQERLSNQKSPHNIEIIPDTLEWFLWMIEGAEPQ